ncbi:MAG: hypothetical protein ACKOTZ_01430 [Chloroflexota bacterium]
MDAEFDEKLRTQALVLAQRYAPWRPGIDWRIVGIEGVVVLLVSLLLLAQGSVDLVVGLLGVVLVAVSGAWAWTAMRSSLPQALLGWRGLRGGVGFATGTLLVTDLLVDYLPTSGALAVLAIGLFLVGAIGCIEWLVGREAMGWRWPSLVGSAIALGYGVVVLASSLQAGPLFIQAVAIVLLVGAAVLLVRAGQLWQASRGAVASGAGAADDAQRPAPRASDPVPHASPAPAVAPRGTGAATRGAGQADEPPKPPATPPAPPATHA